MGAVLSCPWPYSKLLHCHTVQLARHFIASFPGYGLGTRLGILGKN